MNKALVTINDNSYDFRHFIIFGVERLDDQHAMTRCLGNLSGLTENEALALLRDLNASFSKIFQDYAQHLLGVKGLAQRSKGFWE